MSVFKTSPAITPFLNAQNYFGQKLYRKSFEHLTLGFLADYNYKPLYKLALKAAKHQKATEEQQLFQQAINRFYFHEPFFQLGYYYIDKGNYALAEAFLEKAMIHAPDSRETAYELSLALTARFKIARAVTVLKSIDYSSDFWLHYRLQFCKLLNGETHGVTAFINNAKSQLADMGENKVYASFKLEELEELNIRFENAPKRNKDIHFWQYVQYGACILDKPTQKTHVNRYDQLKCDMNFIRNILEKLCIHLATLHKIPAQIMAFPDRDSEIIGRSIALLLNKKFMYYKEYEGTSNTLIVAANANCYNGMDDFIEVKENQSLFAFYTLWDQGTMLCPDISGLLCKTCEFPWHRKRKENYFLSRQKLQLLPAKFIAENIAETEAQTTDSYENILDFHLAVCPFLKGGEKDNKKRLSFMVDSPIGNTNTEEDKEIPEKNTDIV